MANYSSIQTSVQNLLNRRDVTTAQIQSFIQSAMQRIQRGQLRDDQKGGEVRPLRIPAMETTVFVTISTNMQATPGQISGLSIPTDFLELINLIPNSSNGGLQKSDFKRMEKADLTSCLQASVDTGIPRIYCREGGVWILGPAPTIGDIIQIDYYSEVAPLVNPNDTNVISIIAPDLIIYGALCFAGDFFTDIRLPQWEERFKEIWSALADQGMQDDENGGAAVQASFKYPDDLNDGWDYFTFGPNGLF